MNYSGKTRSNILFSQTNDYNTDEKLLPTVECFLLALLGFLLLAVVFCFCQFVLQMKTFLILVIAFLDTFIWIYPPPSPNTLQ